jgi:hypothetical protein
LPGQWIVGGVVATTVTVKLHELELPELSVAAHTTVVVPTGNTLPLGGAQTKLAMPQASEAPAE